MDKKTYISFILASAVLIAFGITSGTFLYRIGYINGADEAAKKNKTEESQNS